MTWGRHILRASQVTYDDVKAGYTAAEFHPDGMLLGTATADSSMIIWETRLSKVRCLGGSEASCLQGLSVRGMTTRTC